VNASATATATETAAEFDGETVPITTCPRCGSRYGANAFVQEYWSSARRIFTCWCAACRFTCDIAVVDRVYSFEPEH
jgi:hypothetical protein